MCEKPLGLNAGEVREMYDAARDAGVVHMTAFTYRFAPSMRYLRHLVKRRAGRAAALSQPAVPRLARNKLGLAAVQATAGAGDLFDMTIHRIDFAHRPAGPDRAGLRRRGPVRSARRNDRRRQACPPSEVDDWSSLIGEFASGATGVWEGTTLAKGYGRNGFGHEWAEINGSEGSAVYRLHEPNTHPAGQDRPGPRPGRRPARVPQARRQPPRSGARASRPPSSATT